MAGWRNPLGGEGVKRLSSAGREGKAPLRFAVLRWSGSRLRRVYEELISRASRGSFVSQLGAGRSKFSELREGNLKRTEFDHNVLHERGRDVAEWVWLHLVHTLCLV